MTTVKEIRALFYYCTLKQLKLVSLNLTQLSTTTNQHDPISQDRGGSNSWVVCTLDYRITKDC